MSLPAGDDTRPLQAYAYEDQDRDVDTSSYNFDPDGRVIVKSPGKGWRISTIVCGIIAMLALVLATGLAIGLGLYIKSANDVCTSQACVKSANDVCNSQACVTLSSQIISRMDRSFDPCQDFYKFACNGYLKDAIIPIDQESTGTFDIPSIEDMERIRVLMTSGNNMSLGAIEKAMTFYNSCMNTSSIEKQSLSSLKQVINNLGGWPLVGLNLGTAWSINDVKGYVLEQLLGSTAFFVWHVQPDDKNSKRNIINIANAGLSMNFKDYCKQNSMRERVHNAIVNVLLLINPSVPTQQYEDAAEEILAFETKICQITNFTHDAVFAPLKRNIVSFDYMSQIFPSFNWIGNMRYYASLSGFNLDSNTPVNLLSQPQYFIGLNELVVSTDSRILQNYAKWHLILNFLQDLSTLFMDIHSSLLPQTGALSASVPRYKFCVAKVESTFKHAVARAFHDVYVLPGTFGNLTVITTELKTALEQRIESNDWLDSTTKQKALDKAKAIIEQLVYPKQVANNAFLENYYSTYNVSLSNGYFLNAVYTMLAARLQEIKQLQEVNDRTQWVLYLPPPTITNAFYTPHYNQIYIFEGILNIPFFKPYWPTFYQYSTIGFVVGHEFTHGFDNAGHLFDGHGNFVNWWTTTSEDGFYERAKCFINQYNKYSLDAGKVVGNQTLGENIADNGGIIAAYLAYKNRVKKTGEVQKKLPGLSYSPDQLFFIGATQLWCRKSSIEAQKEELKDSHSPSEVRPQGFLSNSPDFHAAFNCPVGSPMNPRVKCELW